MNSLKALIPLVGLTLALASANALAEDCKQVGKDFGQQCEKICADMTKKKDAKRAGDCPKACKNQEKLAEKECERQNNAEKK
jgi:hypothetical protein